MVSPIEGAEDLAKQSVIKYGTQKTGSTAKFFSVWAFDLHIYIYISLK